MTVPAFFSSAPPVAAWGMPLIPFQLYPSDVSSTGTILLGANVLCATPFISPLPHVFGNMQMFITSGGTAGSVIRMGIYIDNGKGYPGALVVDLGTVAGTGSGVIGSAGGTPMLLPGFVYWLVCVAQGAPTTNPTVTTIAKGNFLAGAASPGGGPNSYAGGNVAGALPNPFPTGILFAGGGNSPLMCLQA